MEFAQQRILYDQNRGDGSRMSVGGGRRSRLALSRPAAGPACVSRGVYTGRVCWWSSCLRESAMQGPQRKPTLSQHRKCAESVWTLNSALLQLIGGAVTSVELSREVRANCSQHVRGLFRGAVRATWHSGPRWRPLVHVCAGVRGSVQAGDPEGDDTSVVTPSRTARSAGPLARGGATYEVGLVFVATNCDRCKCMM